MSLGMSSSCGSAQNLSNAVNELLDGAKLGGIEVCGDCRFEIEAVGAGVDGGCIGALREMVALAERLVRCREEREGEESEQSCSEAAEKLREARRRAKSLCGDRVFDFVSSVWGEYDCEKRVVRLYLGCYRLLAVCPSLRDASWRYLVVLAHELLHHLQYTGAKLKTGEKTVEALVQLQGCGSDFSKALRGLPYRYRPEEVEAWERQEEVTELLGGALLDKLKKVLEAHQDTLGL